MVRGTRRAARRQHGLVRGAVSIRQPVGVEKAKAGAGAPCQEEVLESLKAVFTGLLLQAMGVTPLGSRSYWKLNNT